MTQAWSDILLRRSGICFSCAPYYGSTKAVCSAAISVFIATWRTALFAHPLQVPGHSPSSIPDLSTINAVNRGPVRAVLRLRIYRVVTMASLLLQYPLQARRGVIPGSVVEVCAGVDLKLLLRQLLLHQVMDQLREDT